MRRVTARRRCPRGFLLLETTASAVLIGVALLLAARLVGGLAAANEAAERRQWAFNEARNTLERVASQPWDRLIDPGSAEAWSRAATERATGVLPDGVIDVSIDDPLDIPDSRLAVEVRWGDSTGDATRSIRLVAWSYRDARGGKR